MKPDNPFDTLLEHPSLKRRNFIVDSAPEVVDMLNLAWAGARAVFEKQAKPEHAFMLLPLLQQAAADERQRRSAESVARSTAGPKPRAKPRAEPKAGPRSRRKEGPHD